MAPEDEVFRQMQEPWYWALDTLRTNMMIHEEPISPPLNMKSDSDRDSGSDSTKFSNSRVEAGGAKSIERESTTSEETTTGARPREKPSQVKKIQGATKLSGDAKSPIQPVDIRGLPTDDEVV